MASSVTVDFNANLARFTGAIDKATNDLNRFQSNASRVSANIGQAFSVLGVGLSIAGITAMIKSTIDAQDHLNDLAKTTRLSVEELSGLASAAKKSGSDLDGTAKAINKLAVEMGKHSEKFAALGVTAKDPLQAFGQLADIMNAIDDPQKRAAVGAIALGKGWADAAPLMAEGGKAIKELIAQGAALSKVTTESAKRADEFNDKWQDLKTIAGGFFTSTVNPIVSGLLKIHNALSLEIGNKPGSIANLIFGDSRVKGWTGKKDALGLPDLTPDAAAPTPGKPTNSALEKFIGGSATKSAKSEKESLDEVTKALQAMAKEWSELGKSGSGLDLFRLQSLGANDAQMALARTMRAAIDASDENMRVTAEVARRMAAEQERMTAELMKQDDVMSDFARKAAENIQDAMANFLFDPFSEGLRGMLEGFTTMLRRMVAEAMAADIARALFGRTVGGIGEGIVGAALSGFLGSTQAPAPVVNLDRMATFAAGTDFIPRDGLAFLHKGEAVIPAAQNSGRGGNTYNVSVSVAVDAGGSRVQGDAAQATELGRRIAGVVRGVLIDERRPGGMLA